MRTYRVAAGARLGELDLNPPTLAQRLEAATRRLAELSAARSQPEAQLPVLDQEIAATELAIAKWKAAQVNVAVHAARDQLAALDAQSLELESIVSVGSSSEKPRRFARGIVLDRDRHQSEKRHDCEHRDSL